MANVKCVASKANIEENGSSLLSVYNTIWKVFISATVCTVYIWDKKEKKLNNQKRTVSSIKRKKQNGSNGRDTGTNFKEKGKLVRHENFFQKKTY